MNFFYPLVILAWTFSMMPIMIAKWWHSNSVIPCTFIIWDFAVSKDLSSPFMYMWYIFSLSIPYIFARTHVHISECTCTCLFYSRGYNPLLSFGQCVVFRLGCVCVGVSVCPRDLLSSFSFFGTSYLDSMLYLICSWIELCCQIAISNRSFQGRMTFHDPDLGAKCICWCGVIAV